MDITYRGSASFLLKAERTVAINPVSATAADIVLHSTRQARSTAIVNGPGEYEVGGVLIVTAETEPGHDSTLIHAIDIGGINVVHLASVPPALSARTIEAFGRVDILIVGAEDLRAAQKVVNDLVPRVVIPFGSRAAELCKALGAPAGAPAARFFWNGIGMPPPAVLLKAPGAKKRAA